MFFSTSDVSEFYTSLLRLAFAGKGWDILAMRSNMGAARKLEVEQRFKGSRTCILLSSAVAPEGGTYPGVTLAIQVGEARIGFQGLGPYLRHKLSNPATCVSRSAHKMASAFDTRFRCRVVDSVLLSIIMSF